MSILDFLIFGFGLIIAKKAADESMSKATAPAKCHAFNDR
jgi:hypothetical protein